ncbi:MAG: hypothetical protein R3B65_01245 [Candidatus Paceibacterota bacterium]
MDTTNGVPIFCQGDGGENGSIGQCNSNDVEISIAGDTPEGLQNITQFNVLKFTVENNSLCDIRFEDMKVAYMATDGKPYFDEIQVRDENEKTFGGK